MKRLFKNLTLARSLARRAKSELHATEVGGTVLSVHTYQYGARDVLLEDQGRRSYVFIPQASAIRHLGAGDAVRFLVKGTGGQMTAVAAA